MEPHGTLCNLMEHPLNMNRLLNFAKQERLYILLLIFIILVNVLIFLAGDEKRDEGRQAPAAVQVKEDIFLQREEAEKVLAGNRPLALLLSLASLLMVAMVALGLFIDASLVSSRLSGRG